MGHTVRMLNARGEECLVTPADVAGALAAGWTIPTTPPSGVNLPCVRPGEPAAQHHRATQPYPDPGAIVRRRID